MGKLKPNSKTIIPHSSWNSYYKKTKDNNVSVNVVGQRIDKTEENICYYKSL